MFPIWAMKWSLRWNLIIYRTITGQNDSDVKWMIVLHYAPIFSCCLPYSAVSLFQTVSNVRTTMLFLESSFSKWRTIRERKNTNWVVFFSENWKPNIDDKSTDVLAKQWKTVIKIYPPYIINIPLLLGEQNFLFFIFLFF